MINEWLYMSDGDNLSSIKYLLSDYDVEYWEEAKVLEISHDGAGADFEEIPERRWDDFCKEYLSENGYDTMYQVSFSKGADKWAESMMHKIVEQVGGRFCADTEDLEPCI